MVELDYSKMIYGHIKPDASLLTYNAIDGELKWALAIGQRVRERASKIKVLRTNPRIFKLKNKELADCIEEQSAIYNDLSKNFEDLAKCLAEKLELVK